MKSTVSNKYIEAEPATLFNNEISFPPYGEHLHSSSFDSLAYSAPKVQEVVV